MTEKIYKLGLTTWKEEMCRFYCSEYAMEGIGEDALLAMGAVLVEEKHPTLQKLPAHFMYGLDHTTEIFARKLQETIDHVQKLEEKIKAAGLPPELMEKINSMLTILKVSLKTGTGSFVNYESIENNYEKN